MCGRFAKRLVLIGLDGAILNLVRKFCCKGKGLPVFQSLLREGSAAEALSSPPTDTPTNWTTIVTGAWTGTHGITSFAVHEKGTSLNVRRPSMDTKLCKAEFIWNAAEKAGKTSIILNYPMAWPPTVNKGVVIPGFPNNFTGMSGTARGPSRLGEWTISPEGVYATASTKDARVLKSAILVSFSSAHGWKNLERKHVQALESTVPILGGSVYAWTSEGPVFEGEFQAEETDIYRVLLLDTEGNGYDRVLISEEKDASKPIVQLRQGEWSSWIYRAFKTERGLVEGTFRLKVLELSPDGEKFILHRTQIFKTRGWAYPEYIADDLVKNIGPFVAGLEAGGRYDRDTYFEQVAFQTKYLVDAAEFLTKQRPWDLLITQIHVQDAVNHKWQGYLYKSSPAYSREKAEEGWRDQSVSYRLVDEMIGNFKEKFVDDDTLLVVVSDHGGCPTWRPLYVGSVLLHAGLLNIVWNEKEKRHVVDWSKTKAFFSPPNHIWVNLKGRDPSGVVNPGDEYEAVREKVIDIFYSLRDPETGICPVAAVLKKEDAQLLGQWGDRDADLILFLKPGYQVAGSPKITQIDVEDIVKIEPNTQRKNVKPEKDFFGDNQPGCQHTHLPTARLGEFTNLGMFIMCGPGVKKGYESFRLINLVDVTPTICYLLQMPFPAQCEGKILFDMLET